MMNFRITLNMLNLYLYHTHTGISGADRGGPGGPTPTPDFEAQIFAATVTPLRDVSKISPTPPYTKSWIRTWILYPLGPIPALAK